MSTSRRSSMENTFSKSRQNLVKATSNPDLTDEVKEVTDKVNGSKATAYSEEEHHTPKQSSTLDAVFAGSKQSRGVPKSIYLKKDVYDFCEEQRIKYNVTFSDIVNVLLEKIIESEVK